MKINKVVKSVFSIMVTVALLMVLAAPAFAEAVTLTGVVESGDNGMVLQSDGKTYVLEGDVAEDMVGKTVAVTGEVVEEDGGAILKVQEIKPAE